jgi:adenine specific DNA methylase Mod
MGIGSEAYQALKFNRKAIGIELKESYYNIAVQNLKNVESLHKNDLFSYIEETEDAS